MLYGLGGLVVLAAAGVALLLAMPPTDLVKQRLAAEVERQTGRKLNIGAAGISLWSGLGVSLADISLSAPPGMGGAPLIRAERLDVSVALLPFVLREVKVERLTLQRPVIELRVDAEGRRSWDFAATGDAGPTRIRYAQAGGRANDAAPLPSATLPPAEAGEPAGRPAQALGLEALSLADVRIADGTIRYADATSGIDREIKGVDARLALPRVGGPLTVDGHVTAGGERLAVTGRLDAVLDIIAERPARLELKIEGAPVSVSYKGRLNTGKTPGIDGELAVTSTSAGKLARFLEMPLAGADELGQVTLAGGLKASLEQISLGSAQIALGPTAATGTIDVKLAQPRPLVKANLHFTRLDLDSLLALGPASGAEGRPSAGTAGRFAAPPVTKSTPTSIDDLLKRTDPHAAPKAVPQVRGFRQRSGNQWDTEAIDVTGLRSFDLDGRFRIGDLRWSGIQATGVHAAAELNGGHLRASVTDGTVSGGKVRGLASLDARAAALTFGANISGDGVDMAPLLKASGVDLIAGTGRAVVTLSARGASERELVSTLAGRAEARLTEGALVGWNAEALLASLRRGDIPSTERQPDARTPFRQLSATFQITQGVARTQDLTLDSAAITVAGKGLVNIVDRNLDLTLRPKIAAGGIEIPVRVAGPWDKPGIVPDLAGALNSPQAQEAARHLRDGNVEGAVRSVLGDGAKTEKTLEKAKDLLRGLFNK